MEELQPIANDLRADVLDMVMEIKDGHLGPAFSAADIITTLYFGGHIHIDPDEPNSPDRDRFILSKGHACPLLYAALIKKGVVDPKHKLTLRKINSILQGHPDMKKTPGVDANSGSLGNGLAMAFGIAKALELQHSQRYVYVICGDGELGEGITWETFLNIGKAQMEKMIVFIDNNRWQSGGSIKAIGGIDKLKEKFEAFSLKVLEIDGHDFSQISQAIKTAKESHRATVILAHTIKGKGVDFMEEDNSWHKRVPTQEEYESALKQLRGKR
jgi:transketolase